MREIKFRAWDKEQKRFFYWSVTSGSAQGGIYTKVVWELDEKLTQQFTGLKDKNGKEIYEGDIVKTHTSVYKNDIFIMEDIRDIYATNSESFEATAPYGEAEVIGNIYENPELMGGKE